MFAISSSAAFPVLAAVLVLLLVILGFARALFKGV